MTLEQTVIEAARNLPIATLADAWGTNRRGVISATDSNRPMSIMEAAAVARLSGTTLADLAKTGLSAAQ